MNNNLFTDGNLDIQEISLTTPNIYIVDGVLVALLVDLFSIYAFHARCAPVISLVWQNDPDVTTYNTRKLKCYNCKHYLSEQDEVSKVRKRILR